MKKQLFFLLSLLTVLVGVVSCTSDDWDDEENKAPSSYVPPVDVNGVWYQSGAKLGGVSAYLSLHLNKTGQGHAVWYARSSGKVSYDEITTSVDGAILTINGCSAYSGNFLVESTGSSLKLKQGSSVGTYYQAKELTPTNLASKSYWTYYDPNNSSYYWRYYFNPDNTGKLIVKSSKGTSTYTYSYTCSSETGTLYLKYSNGETEYCDYACILDNALIEFTKEGSKTYYFVMK